MSKRQEYKKGDIIGPNGLIYIKEVSPYIAPTTGKTVRQAEFECPHCKEHRHFITRIIYAKNGHTKSCGCLSMKAAIENIQQYNQSEHQVWNRIPIAEGEVINKYGVKYIKDVEPYYAPATNRPYRRCEFICPICHRPFVALLNNVTRGLTKGCGIHQSYGEQKVSEILNDLQIKYLREYSFPDLRSSKNRVLYFDFYLPDYNMCIEYDGIQHYEYRENSEWNTKEKFLEGKERDRLKDEYCAANHISLIRIPYTQYDQLNSNFLLELILNIDKSGR